MAVELHSYQESMYDAGKCAYCGLLKTQHPEQPKEMHSLKLLIEGQTLLTVSVAALNANYKTSFEQQGGILAAQDKLWQSLGAVERKLEILATYTADMLTRQLDTQIKLDAGLKGTADGIGLEFHRLGNELGSFAMAAADRHEESNRALAELRKDLGKPREVEPLRLSNDMHTLFMDLLDELRVTRFALATRSASPLGGKARSGTKRRRAARRTRK